MHLSLKTPLGGVRARDLTKEWGFDKGAKILVNYPRVAGSIR